MGKQAVPGSLSENAITVCLALRLTMIFLLRGRRLVVDIKVMLMRSLRLMSGNRSRRARAAQRAGCEHGEKQMREELLQGRHG